MAILALLRWSGAKHTVPLRRACVWLTSHPQWLHGVCLHSIGKEAREGRGSRIYHLISKDWPCNPSTEWRGACWGFTREAVVQWNALPMLTSLSGWKRNSIFRDSFLEIRHGRVRGTSALRPGTLSLNATFVSYRLFDSKLLNLSEPPSPRL